MGESGTVDTFSDTCKKNILVLQDSPQDLCAFELHRQIWKYSTGAHDFLCIFDPCLFARSSLCMTWVPNDNASNSDPPFTFFAFLSQILYRSTSSGKPLLAKFVHGAVYTTDFICAWHKKNKFELRNANFIYTQNYKQHRKYVQSTLDLQPLKFLPYYFVPFTLYRGLNMSFGNYNLRSLKIGQIDFESRASFLHNSASVSGVSVLCKLTTFCIPRNRWRRALENSQQFKNLTLALCVVHNENARHKTVFCLLKFVETVSH